MERIAFLCIPESDTDVPPKAGWQPLQRLVERGPARCTNHPDGQGRSQEQSPFRFPCFAKAMQG
jgi:hypothetical protein